MRFLLDENLPRSIGQLLRGWGHDVLVVADSALRGSSDEVLLHEADLERRIIIKRDLDFPLPRARARPLGVILEPRGQRDTSPVAHGFPFLDPVGRIRWGR